MNNLNKYFQSEIGTTEKIVSLQPFEKIETISETKKFLKLYKLSRFTNNLFSIKRLIHKIFNNKLKCSIRWEKNIWDNTKIILLNCKIDVINNETSIQYIKSIKNYTKNTKINEKRIKDINRLMNKINQGINLDNPLYISGAILNQIGSSINPLEIFMVDGARRLIAHAICKKKYIKIWLIDLK
jgi:hypothetical protein